ncbi:MAG TPA: DUF6448 family protein, partial [Acidobacteriota bacterium]
IETGSVEELKKTLVGFIANEIEKRFERMQHLKQHADESVDMAREYVESMLGLQVWSHKIYLAAIAGPHEKEGEHHHG